MDRARRAVVAALFLVSPLASACVARGGASGIAGPRAGRRSAAGRPRRSLVSRGRDRRRVGVGRVRRAGERGRCRGRPGRARGRLRDLEPGRRSRARRLDGVAAARAGPAVLIANSAGAFAAGRGRDVHRRVRGDRRRDRPAADRRRADRRRRLGRRDERVRRGHGRGGAPAGSSLERRPGGAAGNGTDTNENSADWFVQAAPSPQNLASAPVPAPVPRDARADDVGRAHAHADRDGCAHGSADRDGRADRDAPADSGPDADGDASAHAGAHNRSDADATPRPTPAPTPARRRRRRRPRRPVQRRRPRPRARRRPRRRAPPRLRRRPRRSTPPGSCPTARRDVEGTLTTALGALEGGRGGFVAGCRVAASRSTSTLHRRRRGPPARSFGSAGSSTPGSASERCGSRSSDLEAMGAAPVPARSDGVHRRGRESVEGRRVTVTGSTVGSPSTLADGLGLLVDDGSGQRPRDRAPEALGGLDVPRGRLFARPGRSGSATAAGRAPAATASTRREPGDFAILPAPDADADPDAGSRPPRPSRAPAPCRPRRPPRRRPHRHPVGRRHRRPRRRPAVAGHRDGARPADRP